jgi:hypothetical protein
MGEAEGAIDELHAILAGEAEIGDDEVDGVVFQDADGAGNVGGDIDVETVLEGGAEAFAGVFFVVYY